MSQEKREPFSGKLEDREQLGDFLRRFWADMHAQSIKDEKDKIDAFEDYLKTSSVTDEWYTKLSATNKSSWKAFKTAFKTQFPGVEKASKSSMELERELQSLRLKIEDLGKTELVQGTEVYMHVAFTNCALQLAQRAGIDTGANSIWQVQDLLPDIIKDKVGESHANWAAFCSEIKGVDLTHI
jgi:hypothetical protein